MKRGVKRAAQVLLASVSPAAWHLRERALVVLMYHRILPKGDRRLAYEQPGMYVYPETFRMHVRELKRHFEIVRLSEWIARAAGGKPLPRRACAITLDDAWRDNYEYAYPILCEEGAKATIFACSDMIGTKRLFWPERLALLLNRMNARGDGKAPSWLKALCPSLGREPRLDVTSIDAAINSAKKRYPDEALAAWLDDAGVESDGAELLGWEEIGEMVSHGVIEIGSHTRRHRRLVAGMREDVLRDEIVESKRALEAGTGASVNLFCYPNGDITPEAHRLVKSTYLGACTTRKGWHFADDDPFAIRRIGVHQDISGDRAAFLSRVSGWQ